MRCPLCQLRPARRLCPALDRQICPVCCGTKRLTEIRCPDTCGYLGNAQVHPPAAVRRRQDRDAAVLAPALSGLGDTGQRLFLVTLTIIDRARGEGLEAATDADVADAVGSLARTFSTSAKGLIYEHRPASVPAQRIAAHIRGAFDEMGRALPSSFAATAADVLQRLESCVGDAHRAGLDPGRGFLDLVARAAALFGAPPAPTGPAVPPSPLIVP